MPRRWSLPLLASLGLCLGTLGRATEPAGSAAGFWSAHVEPLLQQRCADCHSPIKTKSGLDLSSLQSILKGGDRGAAVIPGRPEDSLLFTVLQADADPHMPPKKQLTAEETGFIKTWIEKLGVASAGTASAEAAPAAEAAPRPPVWVPPAGLAAPAVIDRFLELGWRERRVKPAPVVEDAAFARRLYLDLAGRIPTAEETARFVNRSNRDKRARLVDELLAGEDYPRHFREVFDVVLMGRQGGKFEQQRADNRWFDYLETAFRSNRPWNEVVRELIVARPDSAEDRGMIWFLWERQNNAQAMAEALAPVVFGVQIQCAQCHDHMIAREIKQAHYWGLAAAFNRTKNVEAESGRGLAESAIGGFVSFANLKKESQPARLTFFNGRNVDEVWPKEGEKETDAPEKYLVPPPAEKTKPQAPAVPKFSRRAALAEAVTEDNPLLARAMVNRVWAMLLGRGLVHPVELMDSKHPPSHPDLLDWLTRDFAESGHDVKRLVRNLTATRAYQLAATPPQRVARRDAAPLHRGKWEMAVRQPAAGNRQEPAAAPEAPGEAFARGLEKPLSAEQLFRSLLVATGNQADADGKLAGHPEKELRRAFVRQFPDLFAAEYNASLQQAMFLTNADPLDALLTPREGNLTARLLVVDDPAERVRAAFQAVFHRQPDREELREATAYLAARPEEAGVKQLLWALLTSAEFLVNH